MRKLTDSPQKTYTLKPFEKILLKLQEHIMRLAASPLLKGHPVSYLLTLKLAPNDKTESTDTIFESIFVGYRSPAKKKVETATTVLKVHLVAIITGFLQTRPCCLRSSKLDGPESFCLQNFFHLINSETIMISAK